MEESSENAAGKFGRKPFCHVTFNNSPCSSQENPTLIDIYPNNRPFSYGYKKTDDRSMAGVSVCWFELSLCVPFPWFTEAGIGIAKIWGVNVTFKSFSLFSLRFQAVLYNEDDYNDAVWDTTCRRERMLLVE